jgi:sugar lactone lactonase YvrE
MRRERWTRRGLWRTDTLGRQRCLRDASHAWTLIIGACRSLRRLSPALLCAPVGCLLITGLLGSPPALAATKYELARELTSTPSGSFENPFAVGVNQAFGEAYVVDKGRRVVDKFEASGLYVSELTGAPASAPVSGPFGEPDGVAVDATGHVYVSDGESRVVDEFDSTGTFVRQISETPGSAPVSGPFGGLSGSVAVDQSSGSLYVGDSGNRVIDEFSTAGVFVRQLAGPPPSAPVSGPFGSVRGLAVDSAGDLYVADSEAKVVDEFDSSGAFLRQLSGTPAGAPVSGAFGNPRALGVDQASNALFVSDNGVSPPVVDQFDSSGLFQGQLQLSSSNPVGVAVDGSGDLYVADNNTRAVKVFARKIVPDVSTGAVFNARDTAATLNGSVNPAGIAVTSCEFEYGPTTSYGSSVACSQSPAEIGSGASPVPVSAALTGLEPRTEYHFRLVAANANGSNSGQDATFITLTPPVVEGESVSEVTSSGATLQTRVNPGGVETSYRFEYGTSTAYGTSLPVPGAGVGSGLRAVPVSARLQELRAGTPYHYRVVAENALGAVQGADHTFLTQYPGGPYSLPDGRAWEMVSPAVKHGGVIEPPGTLASGAGGLIESSPEGSVFTYLSDQSLFAEPQGESNLSQVLATRTIAGWASQDIATPHQASSDATVGDGSEYRFFSSDLSLALVAPFGEMPATLLSPEATERTPYLRNNVNSSYLPLVTAANVPAGTKFGGSPEVAAPGVRPVGASPDLTHLVLHTEEGVSLTSTPVEYGGLYEWAAGRLQLVSVLPDGSAAPDALLGYFSKDVRHAISNDGSRIFWTRNGSGPQNLYMRDTIRGQTLQVDAVQPGAAGTGNANPQFQAASADGSRVFFTDEQQLTEHSTAAGSKADLYECELIEARGELTCKLRDLTVDHNPGESAEVQGVVLGTSEQGCEAGSHEDCNVYFVARGALSTAENEAQETATAGQGNLYVEHFNGTEWEAPTFIVSLSPGDNRDWSSPFGDLGYLTSRVSPNGGYVAFMSERSLTGYDNHDARSGVADEEVYLYDVTTRSLICASCNPSGARPVGIYRDPQLPYLVDGHEAWNGRWLAASVPAWQPTANTFATYQSRYLLDSGRLFFNSSDLLVPQAAGGQEVVYQYEPEGVGGCSASRETFSAKTDGCVDPVSSPTVGSESAFLDASESGADAFFLTSAPLTSKDVDDQRDIYDAHECTAGSPCISQAVTSPAPPCDSADSCRPPSAPPAAALENPATSSFSGEGTPLSAGVSAPHGAKAKPATRAERLAIALRACRRRYRAAKAKRAACERRALRADAPRKPRRETRRRGR